MSLSRIKLDIGVAHFVDIKVAENDLPLYIDKGFRVVRSTIALKYSYVFNKTMMMICDK
jgi:hypothetical protein